MNFQNLFPEKFLCKMDFSYSDFTFPFWVFPPNFVLYQIILNGENLEIAYNNPLVML